MTVSSTHHSSQTFRPLLTSFAGDTNTRDEKLGGSRTADCTFYSIRATKNKETSSNNPKPEPQRTCSLHLTQHGDYGKGGDPAQLLNPDLPLVYTIDVKIFDGTGEDKKEIGHDDDKEASDEHPLSVAIDGLSDQLGITPEVRHDYIQFTLGPEQWKSSDKKSCSVGGWDPRQEYPAVSLT